MALPKQGGTQAPRQQGHNYSGGLDLYLAQDIANNMTESQLGQIVSGQTPPPAGVPTYVAASALESKKHIRGLVSAKQNSNQTTVAQDLVAGAQQPSMPPAPPGMGPAANMQMAGVQPQPQPTMKFQTGGIVGNPTQLQILGGMSQDQLVAAMSDPQFSPVLVRRVLAERSRDNPALNRTGGFGETLTGIGDRVRDNAENFHRFLSGLIENKKTTRPGDPTFMTVDAMRYRPPFTPSYFGSAADSDIPTGRSPDPITGFDQNTPYTWPTGLRPPMAGGTEDFSPDGRTTGNFDSYEMIGGTFSPPPSPTSPPTPYVPIEGPFTSQPGLYTDEAIPGSAGDMSAETFMLPSTGGITGSPDVFTGNVTIPFPVELFPERATGLLAGSPPTPTPPYIAPLGSAGDMSAETAMADSAAQAPRAPKRPLTPEEAVSEMLTGDPDAIYRGNVTIPFPAELFPERAAGLLAGKEGGQPLKFPKEQIDESVKITKNTAGAIAAEVERDRVSSQLGTNIDPTMQKYLDQLDKAQQEFLDDKKDYKSEKDSAFNMALITAGLGMLAGKSPHAFQNIGTAGLVAMKQLKTDLKDLRTEENADKRTRLKASINMAKTGIEAYTASISGRRADIAEQTLAESIRHNRANEEIARAKNEIAKAKNSGLFGGLTGQQLGTLVNRATSDVLDKLGSLDFSILGPVYEFSSAEGAAISGADKSSGHYISAVKKMARVHAAAHSHGNPYLQDYIERAIIRSIIGTKRPSGPVGKLSSENVHVVEQ